MVWRFEQRRNLGIGSLWKCERLDAESIQGAETWVYSGHMVSIGMRSGLGLERVVDGQNCTVKLISCGVRGLEWLVLSV
jgi:hypothetical protein